MSEEKIIYEPEEYGIDGKEFFITEAGEIKMAEDVNEILGGEFICDVLMKSLTDTTNLIYSIRNNNPPNVPETLIMIEQTLIYLNFLLKGLNIPKPAIDESRAKIFYNAYNNMETIKKIIKEEEEKTTNSENLDTETDEKQ